jgi:hypothetical protein
MSVSGVEVRSPGKIFGRSRGNEMVSAVASEVAEPDFQPLLPKITRRKR